MKKLSAEQFLDDYSWLLKSVIIILFVLWAMQGDYLVKWIYDDIKNQPARNPEIEERMLKEVNSFISDLLEKAREDETYGPEDYFQDYKKIERKKKEFSYPYDPPFYLRRIGDLQIIAMQNVGRGRLYSSADVSIAAQDFRRWMERGGSDGEEWEKEIKEMDKKEFFQKTFNWAGKLYSRGFFLALILFFVRMANRRGVAETILADKRKFLLAVIFWPFYILKYPFNIVREIVVEAELRRIGNIFRRLSKNEKELVRSVASESNFWQWIKEFREVHRLAYQRAFLLALVPAMFMYFLSPPLSEAKTLEMDRCGPLISVEIDEETESPELETESVIVGRCSFVDFFDSPRIIKKKKQKVRIKVTSRKIEHIPISGCSFVFACAINTD